MIVCSNSYVLCSSDRHPNHYLRKQSMGVYVEGVAAGRLFSPDFWSGHRVVLAVWLEKANTNPKIEGD
jgi:hypothetical protein